METDKVVYNSVWGGDVTVCVMRMTSQRIVRLGSQSEEEEDWNLSEKPGREKTSKKNEHILRKMGGEEREAEGKVQHRKRVGWSVMGMFWWV